MFRYLQHTDIDKKKWDERLGSAVNRNIYGCSWFLDAVCPGWAAMVDEHYDVLLPLPSRKQWGIWYVFQPFFVQQAGPYRQTGADASGILEAIPAFYRYVDLKLTPAFAPDHSIDQSNYTLTLNRSYEELFKAFAYNTRRNIKKCPETLKITKSFNDQEVIDMFSNNKGATLSGYSKERDQVLLTLLDELKKRNALEKWAVVGSDNELLAAAHFAVFEKTKIFLFSATNEEGKRERAMFLLLDKFIEEHALTNTVLDFSGSNDEQLARFYRGFGADEEIYHRIVRNRLPFFIKWLKK